MDSERFSQGLARVEAAARRIEQAAKAAHSRAAATPAQESGMNGDGAQPGEHAWRKEAEAALSELDQLIARLET